MIPERGLVLPLGIYIYIRTMAELKLTGIALKRPKMLRKHHKYRQGDKFIRNSDVFLLLF